MKTPPPWTVFRNAKAQVGARYAACATFGCVYAFFPSSFADSPRIRLTRPRPSGPLRTGEASAPCPTAFRARHAGKTASGPENTRPLAVRKGRRGVAVPSLRVGCIRLGNLESRQFRPLVFIFKLSCFIGFSLHLCIGLLRSYALFASF